MFGLYLKMNKNKNEEENKLSILNIKILGISDIKYSEYLKHILVFLFNISVKTKRILYRIINEIWGYWKSIIITMSWFIL